MLLYDFPDAYDLLFSEEFVKECTEFFQKIFAGKKIRTVLDCTVGTGLMTIPMAKLGYKTTGSDINKNMIKKAKRNFANYELMPDLHTADFLKLSETFNYQFDLVMSTGNSLAHADNENLITVITEMHKIIKPGGYLYFDTRNWDSILKKKQRFYLFNPIIRDKGRVNHLQVWDYNYDGSMTFNTLLFEEIENKIVSKRQFYVIYYPFRLKMITDILNTLSYTNIQFFKLGDYQEQDITKSNWYCILAQKSVIPNLELKK